MDLKNFILSINIVLVSFIGYICKLSYLGASYEDAAILAIIGVVYCFVKFLDTKKDVITENQFRIKVMEDISNIKNKMSAISMEVKGNPFKR